MFEGSQVLGLFAAALLVVAAIAWVKLMRRAGWQGLDGKVRASGVRIETASQLLVVALGVSAVAAFLAIGGLFAN